MHRHVFLHRAAGVLIFGEALFVGREAPPRILEPPLERLLALGLVGEPPLGVVRRRDELLERDEAFEVGVHGAASFNKKGPVETGPSADRSGRLLRTSNLESGICNA